MVREHGEMGRLHGLNLIAIFDNPGYFLPQQIHRDEQGGGRRDLYPTLKVGGI